MSFELLLSATKKKSILSPQYIVSLSPIIYELCPMKNQILKKIKRITFKGSSTYRQFLYVIIVLSKIIY